MRRQILGLSISDIISLAAVVFGLAIVITYAIDQNRSYNFVDIVEPVELDAKKYRVGDVVSGYFYGTVHTNAQPTVLRRLECDTQRLGLKPVLVSTTGGSQLTGKKVPIFKIEQASLSNPIEKIDPDTNCRVYICNAYTIQPTLGNPRHLQECYKTREFDVLAKEAKQPATTDEAREVGRTAPPNNAHNSVSPAKTDEDVQSVTFDADSGTSTHSEPQSQGATGIPLLDNVIKGLGGN